MKKYTVASVRQNLARALDEAESGVPVMIQRRNQLFRLVPEKQSQPSASPQRLFTVLDPVLLTGQWGWEVDSNGVLSFVERTTAKKAALSQTKRHVGSKGHRRRPKR